MKQSVISSVQGMLSDGFRRLVQQFGQWMRVVQIRSFIEQDLYRTDNPWLTAVNAEFFMDSPELLTASIRTYRSDYLNGTLPITFARSSYHLPNRTPDSIPLFGSLVNRSIGLNFQLDSVGRRMVLNNQGAIASLYAGSLAPEHLFVEFPGVAASNITSYDWTSDPLSQSALQTSSLLLSSAYLDPYVNEWLISLAQSFRNVSDWSRIGGIAGCDVVVKSLRPIADELIFANVSRVAIFDQYQPIVDTDPSADQPYTLETGSGSGSMASFLDDLVNGDAGIILMVEEGGYLFFGQRLLDAANYIVVNRVPMSFVDEQMEKIRENDRKAAGIISGAIVGSIIGSVIVLVILVRIAVLRVTRPLKHLTEAVKVIPSHLGNASTIAGGLALVPSPPPIPFDMCEEEEELHESLSRLVPVFNRNRLLKEPPVNPDYDPTTANQKLILPDVLLSQDDDQKTPIAPTAATPITVTPTVTIRAPFGSYPTPVIGAPLVATPFDPMGTVVYPTCQQSIMMTQFGGAGVALPNATAPFPEPPPPSIHRPLTGFLASAAFWHWYFFFANFV